jgi:hypothetical protein
VITETCQYMTFRLGDELFAINVSQVREVLEVTQITRVPTAPDFVRGVVNVRGAGRKARYRVYPDHRNGAGHRWGSDGAGGHRRQRA